MDHLEAMRDVGVRVHAAAFGFSEPEHVLNPLNLMHADAFFLLENQNDLAYKHHLKAGIDVHERLDETGVPWQLVVTDLWDPATVGDALTKLMSAHRLEKLLVNASVGPNTVTVGATLASLFAPIRLYHPAGERPFDPLKSAADVAYLPHISVPGWTPDHVAILQILADLGGSSSGGAVKERLRANFPHIIGNGLGGDNWAQVEHGRFQPLIEFLERAGAIRVKRAKRRWTIFVTESGNQMATLLEDLDAVQRDSSLPQRS